MKENQQKINKEIVNLAFPNLLSNLSVPLISSVDTALMGTLSIKYIAAVGIGSMLFNFLYWNMGFLRMSTTGITAQQFGADERKKIPLTVIRAIILALFIAVLLIVFQVSILNALSSFIEVKESMIAEVAQYFKIRMYAAPATLLLMVFMGWSFGLQNAWIPLIVTIIINVMNIALSSYFVLSLGWNISGAAIGTVFAQYIGLFAICILLIRKYSHYFVGIKSEISIIFKGFIDLLQMNLFLFIRTVLLTVTFILIFKFSNNLSPELLAVNIVFLQFLNWLSYTIDGFAYATESLVGKYAGLKDGKQIKTTINISFLWSTVTALLLAFIFFFFFDNLFQIFLSKDTNTIMSIARAYKLWLVVLPIVGFASYIWDGIFIGLTATRSMMLTMIISFVGFLLSFYLLPETLGNHRIWLSFSIFLLLRSMSQMIVYQIYSWDRLK